MKQAFLTILGLAALMFVSGPSAIAQNRNTVTDRIIVDDHNGNTISIEVPPNAGATSWTGNIPFKLPVPPAGFPPSGFVNMSSTDGESLRWNNTAKAWERSSVLRNNGSFLEVRTTGASGTGLSNSQQFINFIDAAGNTRGMIQGQNYSDWTNTPEYQSAEDVYQANLVLSIAQLAGSVASFAAEADPFETVEAAITGAMFAAQYAGMLVEITDYETQKSLYQAQLGVEYASSAGDYAEYLRRADVTEKLTPGDIVGMSNGLISKNTSDAQNVMSISLAPIVLGNMPEKGQEHLFNKVGFMGQVPVKVRGVVNQGDFIIPSGLNDGVGVAVSAQDITPAQFTMVVGRAWQSSKLPFVKMIKVAAGLNAKAMAEIMTKQHDELTSMKKEIATLKQNDREISQIKMQLMQLEQMLEQKSNDVREASLRK